MVSLGPLQETLVGNVARNEMKILINKEIQIMNNEC